MSLEFLLLGLLALKRQTGYDLKKFLDTFGRFMRSNTELSQIYRTLGKLNKNGLVDFETTHREGAPDYKTYFLTEDGAQVFLDWLASPYHPPSRFQDPEFSLRFHYIPILGKAATLKLLRTELEAREEQVRLYRPKDRTLVGLEMAFGGRADLIQRSFTMMHVWGATQVDAWIDWLKETIAVVEQDPDDVTHSADTVLRLVKGSKS